MVAAGSGDKNRALSVFGGGDFSPIFLGLLTEAAAAFIVDGGPEGHLVFNCKIPLIL